ncbi:efflux RND transporter periplasmic adaptor subunit [bacterium]|nr:efflux RND transporter periplasmic adaptor subunit [bacterium]
MSIIKLAKIVFFNVIIPITLVFGGVTAFQKMKASRPKPKKIAIDKKIPIVKVENFQPMKKQIEVKEFGSIYMPDEIEVLAKVSGDLVKLSEKVYLGGELKKGDIIAIIEQTDYKLALESAEADVLNKKTLLLQQEEEGKIAKAEWELYKSKNSNAEPSQLRLKIPQIESAKANLKASEANLKKAKVNLERTIIKAPFDAKISQKYATQGQFLSIGSKIVKLQSQENIYIKLQLKESDMALLNNILNNKDAVNVLVSTKFANKLVEKKGKILSIGAELDSITKMIQVIIEIENSTKEDSFPLVSGMYSEVTIFGDIFENLFVLKEDYIKQNRVYIYNNGILQIKDIDVIYQNGNDVFIKGISQNDKIITTQIIDAVNGMKLEIE